MGDADLGRWSRDDLEHELERLRAQVEKAGASDDHPAVSWRALASVFDTVDPAIGRAIVDDHLRAAGFSPAEERATRTWIPWEQYVGVLAALDPLAREGRLRDLGEDILDTPVLRYLGLAVRTLPSLELMLRWLARVVAGPGALLYRGAQIEVIRRSATRVEMIFVPPPGITLPAAFRELGENALGSVARFMGPHAQVEAVSRGRAVAFVATHDAPRGLGRVRAFVQTLRPNAIERALEDAREELAERNESLRERIVELEASEVERRALRAELDEQERLEAVGQLARGVAHDFNNLLTVMLAQAELLALRTGDAHAGDLEAIGSACERAGQLCRQLLAVGHEAPLALETLDLRALVDERRELLRAAAGEPTRVRFELSPAGPVRGDTRSLVRVLLDLVTNAREAMPDGGELTIEASRRDDRARLVVRDSGPGMSEAVRARALEPFFTTRAERGARGLGLPTAFGIVRQLGGTLRVRGADGGGTEVEIALPCLEER